MSATVFAVECDRIQIACRNNALNRRLPELHNQLSRLRRSGERDEYLEILEHYDSLYAQHLLMQTLFKTPSGEKLNAMYAEFYSAHGQEAPDKP